MDLAFMQPEVSQSSTGHQQLHDYLAWNQIFAIINADIAHHHVPTHPGLTGLAGLQMIFDSHDQRRVKRALWGWGIIRKEMGHDQQADGAMWMKEGINILVNCPDAGLVYNDFIEQ